METYQVAELLDVNEETVRRWIRDGKLSAEKSSNKQGNVITESALLEFAKKAPIYAAAIGAMVATASVNTFLAMPAVLAGSLFTYRQSTGSATEAKVQTEALCDALENYIATRRREIDRKTRRAQQLLEEVEELNEEIEEARREVQRCLDVVAATGLSNSRKVPIEASMGLAEEDES